MPSSGPGRGHPAVSRATNGIGGCRHSLRMSWRWLRGYRRDPGDPSLSPLADEASGSGRHPLVTTGAAYRDRLSRHGRTAGTAGVSACRTGLRSQGVPGVGAAPGDPAGCGIPYRHHRVAVSRAGRHDDLRYPTVAPDRPRGPALALRPGHPEPPGRPVQLPSRALPGAPSLEGTIRPGRQRQGDRCDSNCYEDGHRISW
jgi:hypothetical protein